MKHSAPLACAMSATARISCIAPVVKYTCDVATSAVRSSTARANSSGGTVTPSGLLHDDDLDPVRAAVPATDRPPSGNRDPW